MFNQRKSFHRCNVRPGWDLTLHKMKIFGFQRTKHLVKVLSVTKNRKQAKDAAFLINYLSYFAYFLYFVSPSQKKDA